MKTLIAALAFSLLTVGGYAQKKATKATQPAAKTEKKATVQYRCPACGYTSDKKGECPKDKTDLVKVGDYYCPDCYMTSAKPGKCPMCGVDMKKMEAAKTR